MVYWGEIDGKLRGGVVLRGEMEINKSLFSYKRLNANLLFATEDAFKLSMTKELDRFVPN